MPQNEGSVDIFPSQHSGADSNDRLDISTAFQTSETSSFSFPDDRILEVPSLTLLNAATKVAHRLNLAHLIWDLTAISPLYRPRESANVLTLPPSLGNPSTVASSSISASNDSDLASDSSHSDNSNAGSPDLTTLPPHLQPTQTQRLISHHSVLDLLPWSGTRDKLIQVFNLPDHLRPKNAQGPIGLMRLVYDMEDIGGRGSKCKVGIRSRQGGGRSDKLCFRLASIVIFWLVVLSGYLVIDLMIVLKVKQCLGTSTRYQLDLTDKVFDISTTKHAKSAATPHPTPFRP